MKTLIRISASRLAALTGLLGASERAAAGGLTVLCYHRVLPQDARELYHDRSLVVTPEALDVHCAALRARYTVLPLKEALARWQAGERPQKPFAAMTFDDGYRDNAHHAAPILERHGLRGTFFVIVGLVGTDELPWYDAAGAAWQALARAGQAMPEESAGAAIARAKSLSPDDRRAWLADLQHAAGEMHHSDDDRIMTQAQIRSLVEAGHEVGSHSMTHPLLPQCSDDVLEGEIDGSRKRLEELLQRPVAGMCYPNGDSDERVARVTERAGYAYAASVVNGVNDRAVFNRLALRRWFIDQDRLSDLAGRQSGDLLRMEVCGLSQKLFRRGAAA